MYVIATGSRSMNDDEFIAEKLANFMEFKNPDETIFINFMCRGVTNSAVKWARKAGLQILDMPADWVAEPKDAARIRNHEAAKLADELFVVQFEGERETKALIEDMKRQHKNTWVGNVPKGGNHA